MSQQGPGEKKRNIRKPLLIVGLVAAASAATIFIAQRRRRSRSQLARLRRRIRR